MGRRHAFSAWNTSASTAERSAHARDAANRILDGFFTPELLPDAPAIGPQDPVFAMGSCFARELESVLRRRKFAVTSLDEAALGDAALWGDSLKDAIGFFHRYNTPSMALEFRRAFEPDAFDEECDLLIDLFAAKTVDLHYSIRLPRLNHAGAVARRRVARDFVARAAQAKAIILTLGLTESWLHKPSGLYCNGMAGDVLARRGRDFELRFVSFEENMRALKEIYDCLQRHHVSGDFSLFITVSPVPLQSTFGARDIVVENARAKATLRAVADEFCAGHDRVHYFPSYEIALYSNPDLVWRPDRVHVNKDCVKHIVGVFSQRYLKA